MSRSSVGLLVALDVWGIGGLRRVIGGVLISAFDGEGGVFVVWSGGVSSLLCTVFVPIDCSVSVGVR